MSHFLNVASFALENSYTNPVVPDADFDDTGLEQWSLESDFDDCELLADDIDKNVVTLTALESVLASARLTLDDGGMTDTEARFMVACCETLYDHIDRSDLRETIGLEDYGRFNSRLEETKTAIASLEDSNEGISKSVAAALAKLWEMVNEALTKVFTQNGRMTGAINSLKGKVKKAKKVKKDAEFKSKTIEKAFSTKSKKLSAQAVKDVLSEHKDLLDNADAFKKVFNDVIKKLDDEISKSVNNRHMANLEIAIAKIFSNAKFKGMKESKLGKDDNNLLYKTQATETLVNGTKVYMSYSVGEESRRTKGIVVVDTKADEAITPKGDALDILSTSDMNGILSSAESVTKAIKSYERNSRDLKNFSKKAQELLKQLVKESGDNSKATKELKNMVNDASQAYANYTRNAAGLSTTAVYGALDYVNGSLKKYESDKSGSSDKDDK